MIGTWGYAALQFYIANSQWINLILLVYGFWLILSWVNLKNIRKMLILSLEEQMKGRAEFGPGEITPKALSNLAIPWESAVQQARFPFVARQNAWLPRRLSVNTIRALLPAEDLTGEAVRIHQLHRQTA